MNGHGILNWKKCKKCGKKFDMYIISDYCPECRRKDRRVKWIL